ncbi:MAG: glycosyltransferase family 2 protein [Gemmatimonadetes bacterium]|nr:glycosyltransferase family 2 protein [Gemmatimonadota bacterium]
MTPPRLHIGILTHNGLDHTTRCLASLQAHTQAPWRAVVVDNASQDDTPAFLRGLDDARIAVECRHDNLGVGGGRNRLFTLLLPEVADDDLVVFLDNDIEVGGGWEAPFLEAFARAPRLGVAGAWAFSMQVHESWRDIFSENGRTPGPVDTVQGCCFVVRGAVARALGGFDEALGSFWHEDDDYCIRALQAGWEVERVTSPAIVHHEHGSGVALRPEKIARSYANQAYLARKWRAMAAIDDHGIPRRPVPEPLGPLAAALGTRLGRGRPLVRAEVNSALGDCGRLLRGALSDEAAAVAATPAVRALLAMSRDEPVAEHRAQVVAAEARVEAILAARREASGRAVPAGAAVRAFNALCSPHAWEDARWSAGYRAAFRDGLPTDFYSRSEAAWRDGQLVHALRVTGALARGARVLVLGHPAERMVAALTHLVGDLFVYDAALPTEAMVRGTGQRIGEARLHFGQWTGALRHDDAPLDAIVVPNVGRLATAPRTQKLLRTLAGWLTPQGMLAAALTVRLTGPRTGAWCEVETLADDAWLAAMGLRRVGAFDATVPDATLLAAAPAAQEGHWRPSLSRLDGPHQVTIATLVARRAATAAP